MSARNRLACLTLVFLTLLSVPAAAAQYRWRDIERVVAFGDVHGAYEAMRLMLLNLDIIDAQDRWVAGRTHLVSLGDLLDRGAESRKAMDLLMQLQAQAKATGGMVHVVLGNHEVMNLTGDLRYVAAAEFAAFADVEEPALRESAWRAFRKARRADSQTTDGQAGQTEKSIEKAFAARYPAGFFGHRKAFSPEGKYGSWLLSQALVLVVNDSVFAHGGLPVWLSEFTLDEINQHFMAELTQLLDLGATLVAAQQFSPWTDLLDQSSLLASTDEAASHTRFAELQNSEFFGEQSPTWYRGTAQCHPLIESARIARVLDKLGVERVVLGHTPTNDRRIQQRFAGRVVLADTGMLASYYRGQPSAVVLNDDGLTAQYPLTESTSRELSTPDFSYQNAAFEQALTAELENSAGSLSGEDGQTTTLEIDGFRVQIAFRSGSQREVRQALAAYRLDRLLQLDLVPLTVANAKPRGVLTVLPAATVTEQQRAAAGTFRPNPCGAVNDLQLMYAFDALVRNEARTAKSILYDRASWELRIVGYEKSFGSANTFPDYLQQVPTIVPKGFANTLTGLNESLLDATLEDLLSARQRKGILARRDQLLSLWRIEE